MRMQCSLIAASGGGPAEIQHWRMDTEETSFPKLIATRVDFASVQPFCESLLLKESDAAVQVICYRLEPSPGQLANAPAAR